MTLSLPQYSFLNANNPESCFTDLGLCLPVVDDTDIVFPIFDTESGDTGGATGISFAFYKNGSGSSYLSGTTSPTWYKYSVASHKVYTLVVDSFTPGSDFYLWYLNTYESSYGTWSYSGGQYTASGDISGLAGTGTFGGISWVKHTVYHCYLTFSPDPTGTPSSGQVHDMLAYLNATYPAYGGWTYVAGSPGQFWPGTGDISGVSFTSPISVDSTEFTLTRHCSPTTYFLSVSSYTPSSSDEGAWLTHIAGGTWSYSSGAFTWTGDLSSFTESISGMTYHIVTTVVDDATTWVAYINLSSLGSWLSGVTLQDCITLVYGGITLQCMQLVDGCFTSLIKYRCNENSFGFAYYALSGGSNVLASFYNQVRLPIFIHNPQTKSDKEVYRRSDGNYVKLKAWMEKQHEMETDWLPDFWHDCLHVAIEHDDFEIYNDVSAAWVQYSFKDGDYEREWKNEPGINLNNCKATFKLNEMPFNNFNTNCLP